MGALTGLLGGIGLLFVWLGLSQPPVTAPKRRGQRIQVTLVQAGLPGVRPIHVIVVCGLAGLLVFLTATVSTRSWVISTAFALFASCAPWLLVRRLRRRRLLEQR